MARKLQTVKLSRRFLERCGYLVGDVETRLAPTIKRDLWGVDLVAIDPLGHTCWIQVTTTGNLPARVKKLLAVPEVPVLLERRHTVAAWGWMPDGKRFRCQALYLAKSGKICPHKPHLVPAGPGDPGIDVSGFVALS